MDAQRGHYFEFELTLLGSDEVIRTEKITYRIAYTSYSKVVDHITQDFVNEQFEKYRNSEDKLIQIEIVREFWR